MAEADVRVEMGFEGGLILSMKLAQVEWAKLETALDTGEDSCRKSGLGRPSLRPATSWASPERTFETKIALGLKMVKRVKANGVPFDLLACDALYGRDSQFRADLDGDRCRVCGAGARGHRWCI